MSKFTAVSRFFLIGLLALGVGMAGCTKKPNNEDLSKLEEARSAAEGAERKLAELRQERAKLEQELQTKQQELQINEKERDDLNSQVNK